MCIFADSVKSVTKTKIAAWATKTGGSVTVYQNHVVADPDVAANAMILPVPVDKDHEIKLYNLQEYPEIYDDLEDMFPKPRTLGGRGFYLEPQGKRLEVFQIGGYKVSIAKNTSDLYLINENCFKVSDATKKALEKHYSSGFGFVICAFTNANVKAHPIAYSGGLTKDGEMFVPTLHEHGDGGGWADWDHTIYTINPVSGGVPNCDGKREVKSSKDRDVMKMFGKLAKEDIPLPGVDKDNEYSICKEVVTGTHKNQDTYYKI
jgi:hypothetical protein